MITGSEARKLKAEYDERVQDNKKKKAEEWCETVAHNAIMEESKKGKTLTDGLNPPEDVIDEVRTYLIAHHFSVGVIGNGKITIKW